MTNTDKLIAARNTLYEIIVLIKTTKGAPLPNTHVDGYDSAEMNLWAAYTDIDNIVEDYIEGEENERISKSD